MLVIEGGFIIEVRVTNFREVEGVKFISSPYGKLYLGDAVEKVPEHIEDNFIDCVITDPPYGINFAQKMGYKWRTKMPYKPSKEGDDIDADILFKGVLTELFPKLKDGAHIYIFTRWDVYPKWFEILREIGYIPKNLLIWDKGAPTMGDLKGTYQENNEYIIFAIKPGARRVLNGARDKTLVQGHGRVFSPFRLHPFEKPVSLYTYLIEKSTEVGEVVADPFAGSGPLLEAAILGKRKFMAVEKDPHYFEVCIKRYLDTLNELREREG